MLGSVVVVNALQQTGTFSYAKGLTLDHRGSFVDIDFKQLLQLDTVNLIIPPSGRLLRSGNPEDRDRYLVKVTEYYDGHQRFDMRWLFCILMALTNASGWE
jgi:hypothetical protein